MPSHYTEAFCEVGVCARTGRRIRLCYHIFGANQTCGSTAGPPWVLLLMGAALPGILWEDDFCTALAAAGPFRVVRFDSRDVGWSTHLDDPDPDNPHIKTTHEVNSHNSPNTKFNTLNNNSTIQEAAAAPAEPALQPGRDKTPPLPYATTGNQREKAGEAAMDEPSDLDAFLGDSASSPVPSPASSHSSSYFDAHSNSKDPVRAARGSLVGRRPTTTRAGLLEVVAAALTQRRLPGPPPAYGIPELVQDVVALLDSLQIARVHLVGFCLGAVVAQGVARRYPTRVRSVVLISVPPVGAAGRWPGLRWTARFLFLLTRCVGSVKHDPAEAFLSHRDCVNPYSIDPTGRGSVTCRDDSTHTPTTTSTTKDNNHAKDDDHPSVLSSASSASFPLDPASVVNLVEHTAGHDGRFPFDRLAWEARVRRVLSRRFSLPSARRQLQALFTALPCGIDKDNAKKTSNDPIDNNNKDNKSFPSGRIPVLLLHGAVNMLSPVENVTHTAAAIPGSRVILVPGMGHPLVPALYPRYVHWITQTIQAGEATAKL